ncbi:Effector protein hopD2 [Candidatus Rubidus massiliensis]|nr:Effector protein hopD2 [Candidatus Rubidus massiliensis]
MKSSLFWLVLTIIIISGAFMIASKPKYIRLLINNWNIEKLPRHFRTSKNAFITDSNNPVSTQGLSELNISGSGQFSLKGLNALKKVLVSENVLFVDLRQESHGFLNGIAVSWYAGKNWANKGRHADEIKRDEKKRLENLLKHPFTIAYYNKHIPLPLIPKRAFTEQRLIETNTKWQYMRLPISDHKTPLDVEVDHFINVVKQIPQNTWIHFHCGNGDCRTTTMMAMFDMIKNSSHVSFEDIILRQWFIGGINLFHEPELEWKKEFAKERIYFLKNFYQYCNEITDFSIPWSTWVNFVYLQSLS